MYVSKYDYPQLNKITSDDGSRQYVTSSGISMPSVTTILADTGDKSGLQAWRDWVGEDAAATISRQAANLGTKVHNALESFMLGKQDYLTEGSNLINVLARSMTEKMIADGLSKADEVWGFEEHLYVDKVYAGTADCIGIYAGKESIIDFKTATKIKQKSQIGDYFQQGAAYALAHNAMFGTDIRQVVILMVDRESKFKCFEVKGKAFVNACDLWGQRVLEYYNSREAI